MSLTSEQIRWRRRIFLLTWVAYAGFYFGRKNLAVTWSSIETELGLDGNHYATIIFIYSLIYTIGQFVNGYLSDTFGPRKVVSIGLFIAAISNFVIGFSYAVGVIVFLLAINGYGQSTGWSGLVKNMTPWFKRNERGIVMSWWSTCYVIGAFLATVFATYVAFDMDFMQKFGWRRGFLFPSIILLIIAFLYSAFTRNNPKEVDIPIIVTAKYSFEESEVSKSENGKILKAILTNNVLWIYSSCYFILKLTRYAFLFWLPIYLERSLNYNGSDAGYLSSIYELVGFIGVILAGYTSDKIFGSKRFSTITIMLLCLAAACLIHPYLIRFGNFAVIVSIATIGIATYGPDALICTAGAMDVGGKKGAAVAAGVINGVGSFGQMFSGFIVVAISEGYGWSNLFYFFVFLSLLGASISALKWNFKSPDIYKVK